MSKKLSKKQMKTAKGGCSGPSAKDIAMEALIAAGFDPVRAAEIVKHMAETNLPGAAGYGCIRKRSADATKK